MRTPSIYCRDAHAVRKVRRLGEEGGCYAGFDTLFDVLPREEDEDVEQDERLIAEQFVSVHHITH